ncbi:MAG: arginyltransferase [Deltaproteobacteria bacterium]|nr:arginyltransferase [Deltaproteobacteria bacterium]
MSTMILYRELHLDHIESCPYLQERAVRHANFLASELSPVEISVLLAQGWRKFGIHFFRPACPDCMDCTPLRIHVPSFDPSKSQRRVARKNRDMTVRFLPSRYQPEYYNLFQTHSRSRFGQDTDIDHFLHLFHAPSCPGLVSEFRLGERLVGLGYLDWGRDCLSSVYFVFDPAFSDRSPGIFGVLAEIEHARALRLDWYYLGYFVPGCPTMAYKDRFNPRQYLDWNTGIWVPAQTSVPNASTPNKRF